MAKNLVIVESPAKAKTIKKYLGTDFEVLASYGHVRDLIPKSGAVEPDNNFAMRYESIEKNQKHLDAIVKALKSADNLMLATDPDREGEAISWHIQEYLKEKKILKDKPVSRVVFHEITKKAIQDAVAHPRELAMDLVNAQQARRALDYLVGFNLSPLLWKKVRPSLSAGRVQSPALRMICERETEIKAFMPQEYWTIDANLSSSNVPFTGKLTEYKGEKVKQFSFTDAQTSQTVYQTLFDTFGDKIPVIAVEKKQRNRFPSAPFTTSTLQQEASRKLGFSASRTMRTAQNLYEGINLGSEVVGLITYMRTDSVALAQEALDEIRPYILQKYGQAYLPAEAKEYKTKSKNAQEAHEAVRPTSILRTPDEIKNFLNSDQFRLYELIWKRTLACQMTPAIMDTVAIDLGKEKVHQFRATGSTIAFPGFITVYQEDVDDAKTDDAEGKILPPLKPKDVVNLHEIIPTRHFTEPPPRFSEASLVKTLEEYGIGRPSTFASIISTLQSREYVTIENRRFTPTDIGMIVSKFLTDHFTQYVDYNFTANLEDQLDEVSRGEKEWIPLLKDFWTPFITLVTDKEQSVSRAEVAQSRELGIDPQSGKPVSVRMGRFGPFAQIGDKEDEIKPTFASLKKEQRIDSITLEEALDLFQLPRALGETAEGYTIKANVGRFGPYLQYASKSYVSLKEDDPYTIELPKALELIEAHKIAQAAKFIKAFEGTDIQVLNGRFGPYITDGSKNAKIPKDVEPMALTLAECQDLLEKAPVKKGGKKVAAKKPAAKKATSKKLSTAKDMEEKAAKPKATKTTKPTKASASTVKLANVSKATETKKAVSPKKAVSKTAKTKKVEE